MLPHRKGRSPGQRFRIEQYLSFLEHHGFEFTISNLISEKDDEIFYQKRHFFKKFLIFLKTISIRKSDLKKIHSYDAVFIYRESVMHGSVYFERKIAKAGIPIIYDFDDSIWLLDVSEGNKSHKWLKRPMKVAEIIKLSTITVTGNQYLHDFAKQYGKDVRIIPTTIDTEIFKPENKSKTNQEICIGWTGSSTTLKHFLLAIPFLKKIIEKYPQKIKIKLIADQKVETTELEYEFIQWNPNTEAEDLNEIDIGIMPLPDDQWSRGKCGFKGLQYMAFGKPSVMSPVGVNSEIISDGINGFLASTQEEWIEKLSLLIEAVSKRTYADNFLS
jgi:glycosyltransferase involved in cell wall biosynthesis